MIVRGVTGFGINLRVEFRGLKNVILGYSSASEFRVRVNLDTIFFQSTKYATVQFRLSEKTLIYVAETKKIKL